VATEIRDDAFDLDALVLADMPFDAYYPVEVGPTAPAAGGLWRFVPEISPALRRRRWTYVGRGGMVWGGSARWEFRPLGVPPSVWAYAGEGGMVWGGEAAVWFSSPEARRLDWVRRDDDDMMGLGIL